MSSRLWSNLKRKLSYTETETGLLEKITKMLTQLTRCKMNSEQVTYAIWSPIRPFLPSHFGQGAPNGSGFMIVTLHLASLFQWRLAMLWGGKQQRPNIHFWHLSGPAFQFSLWIQLDKLQPESLTYNPYIESSADFEFATFWYKLGFSYLPALQFQVVCMLSDKFRL